MNRVGSGLLGGPFLLVMTGLVWSWFCEDLFLLLRTEWHGESLGFTIETIFLNAWRPACTCGVRKAASWIDADWLRKVLLWEMDDVDDGHWSVRRTLFAAMKY